MDWVLWIFGLFVLFGYVCLFGGSLASCLGVLHYYFVSSSSFFLFLSVCLGSGICLCGVFAFSSRWCLRLMLFWQLLGNSKWLRWQARWKPPRPTFGSPEATVVKMSEALSTHCTHQSSTFSKEKYKLYYKARQMKPLWSIKIKNHGNMKTTTTLLQAAFLM